ncbi:hypothetical protein AGMMS49938_09270 [Fibrobacterales bacterium]|nr:hypothetical protein AGMMS49938_09270 [Fibrobacterales bacterium]
MGNQYFYANLSGSPSYPKNSLFYKVKFWGNSSEITIPIKLHFAPIFLPNIAKRIFFELFAEKFSIFADMSRFIKFAGIFLIAMVSFVILSCNEEKKVEVAESPDNEYIEPAVEIFREPADTQITYKTARNFNKASEALVAIGEEWAIKMSGVPDEEKLKLAASYEKAQDDLVRKFGLCGMEEFAWIQNKALKDTKNKDVFAQAGVFVR